MDFSDLLTNPLIIGAIIWFVSKIFTGRKQEEENKRKERPIQVPNQQERPKPVFTTADRETERRNRKEAAAPPEPVQEAYEQVRERMRQREASNRTKETVSRLNQPRKPLLNESKKDNEMLSFNKKTVVQAVIYSEILGKPRSKSQHFTRRHF
ncbi:hypothetical protein [Metabacillus fastidiosus]|uniref:hypothetical protein n=1 Tax=Metabacillus fastidiosus TaxID=1458 RepID=UPI002DB7BDB6|nr:hypothetical protein [Metabacillus fastidiosus]MEC2076514.1 hypothetical protein [Metabacillus fastidiosus]